MTSIQFVHAMCTFAYATSGMGFLLRSRNTTRLALVPLAMGAAAWHLAALLSDGGTYTLQIFEVVRYGAYISSLILLVGPALSGVTRLTGHTSWLLAMMIVWGFSLSGLDGRRFVPYAVYMNLLLALVMLLAAEQVYRIHGGLRIARVVSACTAALALYDLYILTYLLVFAEISLAMVETRVYASLVVALFLAWLVFLPQSKGEPARQLSFSKPAAVSTTSLIVAGSFLVGMATLGYMARLLNAEFGELLQSALFFAGILFSAFLFTSARLRAGLRVWVNKHFFQHKHDYREEWKSLNNNLAEPFSGTDYLKVAIRAVMAVYDSPGGVLFLERGGYFQPFATINAHFGQIHVSESSDTQFTSLFRERQWNFFPGASDVSLGRFDSCLPVGLRDREDLLVIAFFYPDAGTGEGDNGAGTGTGADIPVATELCLGYRLAVD